MCFHDTEPHHASVIRQMGNSRGVLIPKHGKERSIQSMNSVSYWSPDGRMMSATQFLKELFGTLPS